MAVVEVLETLCAQGVEFGDDLRGEEGVMVCLGGVADGGGDVVLFKGNDGYHFAVCVEECLVEVE
jgi:hypothetical protein